MDIFYYSTTCPHCQKVIQFITKNNITHHLSCINIDKRKRDHNQNQLVVVLESGQTVFLPPNLNTVPSILCPKRNYELLSGVDNILKYLKERFSINLTNAVSFGDNRIQIREPVGTPLGSFNNNSNIYSEQFTPYGLDPETLSAKSTHKRDLYNYVSVDHNLAIHCPEETWKPDKINVTIDSLQQQRNQEIPAVPVAPPSNLYGQSNQMPSPL
jgi:hypothetical protein